MSLHFHNSERFEVHLPGEFDQYIDTMFENEVWRDEPEILDFSYL